MKFHRQPGKVIIEMGPLTLAAIGNLTTAIDNLTANLPVDSDDASDAALIDAQTSRIEALTPAVPVTSSDGTVPTEVPAVEAPATVGQHPSPDALPGQS